MTGVFFLRTPTPGNPTDKLVIYYCAVVLSVHVYVFSMFGSPFALNIKENMYTDNMLSGCNESDVYYKNLRARPTLISIQGHPILSPSSHSKG